MHQPAGRLSTRPEHLGLGVGCSITALTLLYAAVAMALPGGLGSLTTVRSGLVVILAGIAVGWVLSLRYFTTEQIAPGVKGLHFPVTYQFEDYASWRYRWLSLLDALAYVFEAVGQLGWLILMPLHRSTHRFARQLQSR